METWWKEKPLVGIDRLYFSFISLNIYPERR